jgi:DNA primase
LANFIPENKISEIRNIADIIDIVSEAVLLKKTGRNYVGLCPFHNEKEPSFTVSPDKQIFYCFGCGVGGNVFSFLMEQYSFSFPEAVKMLATRYGIERRTQKMTPEQKKRINERESIYAINRQAMDFFSNTLSDSAAGKKALTYFKQRGMNQDTINGFKLGYAPGGWNNLLNFFKKKKVSAALIEKCGLVIPRKNENGYYDRFRDRVMFPIFDVSMQVIGFGGRDMGDSLPKYLNSPETLVYNKSRSLYGIHQAKNPCRQAESVFIVEGYFDLLAMHQHGMTNSVATLGTSLTLEHIRILKGLIGQSGKIILVYDSDNAGIRAAERSIEVFDKGHVDAQILILDTGYDPDSYLFKFGTEAFAKFAGKALGIISFLLESAIKKHDLTVDGKIRILNDLKEPLSSINDKVARSLYIKELAERIDIEEQAVLEKIKEVSAKITPEKQTRSLIQHYKKEPRESDASAEKSLQATGSRLERQIISMMLQFPDILSEVGKREVLEYFEDKTLKAIGEAILDCRDSPANRIHSSSDSSDSRGNVRVSEIMNHIDKKETEPIIAALASQEYSWEMNGCRRLLNQFIQTSQDHRNKRLLERQISEAEKQGDQKLLEKLLIQKQHIAVSKQKQKMTFLRKS